MHQIRKAFRMFTLILFVSTFWATCCYGVTADQIFVWVSRHMHIEYAENMPEVKYVGKQELQQVFQRLSQASLEKWRIDLGEAKAQTIMASYLDRVLGLFDPVSETIYVGIHLTPCEQQTVLAHEITHYFQNLRDGPINMKDYGAEDQHMFREMEAYHMGAKFKELYCDSSDDADINLALLYAP